MGHHSSVRKVVFRIKLSLKEESCHLANQMHNQLDASSMLGFVPNSVKSIYCSCKRTHVQFLAHT